MSNTWGALKWGQGVWGDTSSSAGEVSGISLTATLDPVAFAGPGEGWGDQLGTLVHGVLQVISSLLVKLFQQV